MAKAIECWCGKTESVDDDSLRTECFKHHVSGVSFTWVGGGGYGRKAFSEHTIASKTRELIGDQKLGEDVVPKGRG
jgi:hypothetical protein